MDLALCWRKPEREEPNVARRPDTDLEPVAATRAKVHFGDILHQTSVNGKKFVVNRQGRPVSVIMSYNEYCRLMEGEGRGPPGGLRGIRHA